MVISKNLSKFLGYFLLHMFLLLIKILSTKGAATITSLGTSRWGHVRVQNPYNKMLKIIDTNWTEMQ